MDLCGGRLMLCSLRNFAPKGLMPREVLVPYEIIFYEERTLGYNRIYAAQGANQQIDMLVRVWENRVVKIGHYAVLEDNTQYRITAIQQLLNSDGLKCTDLTLEKLEDYFSVEKYLP